MSRPTLLAVAVAGAVMMTSPYAFAADDTELQALRAEIAAMKQAYESRIDALEDKLVALETARIDPAAGTGGAGATASAPATGVRTVRDNSFNPAVGVILNGRYGSYSAQDSEVAGFVVGHEGERPEEGLRIDETELNFSASVDDKFHGNATIALHEHDGETEVEIEEAYVRTTALPGGLDAKAGRFFVPLGYLNEQHTHADDFADRPLPSRVFLNRHYSDDGLSMSWILPTDLYTELGGSILRGHGFAADGGDGNDLGAWNAYARLGGDIGDDTAWRLGVSTLQANGIDRLGNEDLVAFEGDSNLYVADARLIWAPDGNNYASELILQGEYFVRREEGAYDDTDAGTGFVPYDEDQSGWYLQGVYKWAPQWRAGLRYSALSAGGVPAGLAGSALDDGGHDPWAASAMVDWSNSEFSRLRLQYNREDLAAGQEDDQFMVQYIMSIGAHGAHPF